MLWGTNLNAIYPLQKKAVRMITCNNRFTHTEPIFKNLSILKLEDLYKGQIIKFYYKLVHELSPTYFNSYLNIYFDISHRYALRNIHMRTPKWNHNYATKCLLYIIPRILRQFSRLISDKIHTHYLSGLKN